MLTTITSYGMSKSRNLLCSSRLTAFSSLLDLYILNYLSDTIQIGEFTISVVIIALSANNKNSYLETGNLFLRDKTFLLV